MFNIFNKIIYLLIFLAVSNAQAMKRSGSELSQEANKKPRISDIEFPWELDAFIDFKNTYKDCENYPTDKGLQITIFELLKTLKIAYKSFSELFITKADLLEDFIYLNFDAIEEITTSTEAELEALFQKYPKRIALMVLLHIWRIDCAGKSRGKILRGYDRPFLKILSTEEELFDFFKIQNDFHIQYELARELCETRDFSILKEFLHCVLKKNEDEGKALIDMVFGIGDQDPHLLRGFGRELASNWYYYFQPQPEARWQIYRYYLNANTHCSIDASSWQYYLQRPLRPCIYNLNNSIYILEKIIKNDSNLIRDFNPNMAIYIVVGRLHAAQGNWESSAELYEAIIEQNADLMARCDVIKETRYLEAAFANHMLKNWDKSARFFKEALPGSPEILIGEFIDTLTVLCGRGEWKSCLMISDFLLRNIPESQLPPWVYSVNKEAQQFLEQVQ